MKRSNQDHDSSCGRSGWRQRRRKGGRNARARGDRRGDPPTREDGGTKPSAARPPRAWHPGHQLGRMGELWVAACLEDRGYRILGRNIRQVGDEIDIVARRGEEILFVEVKTRRSAAVAPPEAAIDRRKRQAMVRAADRYLAGHPVGRIGWGPGPRRPGRPPSIRAGVVVASVLLESVDKPPRIRYLPAWVSLA